MFFFFLHSHSKNTLILSSRPEVLWTGVEGSAFLKAIPVADVPTSLDMTLGGRFADMNMKIKPSKFYLMTKSVVENRLAGSRQAAVQRYVDILTDAGLKAVFGDQRNKDVLIDLLNVIPPRKTASFPNILSGKKRR